MKRVYFRPITQVIEKCELSENLLGTNSEPEVTENIGAKEMVIDDFEWDNTKSRNLWDEE